MLVYVLSAKLASTIATAALSKAKLKIKCKNKKGIRFLKSTIKQFYYFQNKQRLFVYILYKKRIER